MANTIDPETQKKLNQPEVNPKGLAPEEQKFLDDVVAKAEGGAINLMQPGSLINHAVYDHLTEEQKGKVDFDAVNLASTLRDMVGLWKAFRQPTFQIENLVQQIRLTKERLEGISGDVYVI